LFEDAARRGLSAGACQALGLDPRAVRAVERAWRQLARGLPRETVDAERLLRCVLAGFPDRVCRRRAAGSDRAVMVGGTGVVLAPESVVRDAELFVAVDLERGKHRPEAVARLASAVRREWLEALFPGAVTTDVELGFDAGRAAVVEWRRARYADLVLAESIRTDVDRARAGELLADAVLDDPPLVAR